MKIPLLLICKRLVIPKQLIYILQAGLEIETYIVEDYLIHSNHSFYRLNYDGCVASPQVTGLITLLVIVIMLIIVVVIIYITTCTGSYLERRRQKRDEESLLYS